LTGLRSRAGMQDDLTRELRRYQRNGKPFCVSLLDIDFFKKVNDTYGHANGDRVLSAVANYLGRSLRPFDDAWRWGGEEILLCLKETDIVGGKIALERVRGGLEKLSIALDNGAEIKITASFGLVAATTEATIENMLAEADKALYRAKAGGRNRVETAPQEAV
jgi:diguanylate cyclase (GGDEF)-like protein